MSVDPRLIRAEPCTEVGRLIQRDTGILIDRWSQRAVQEQPNAARVHHTALIDHLYDLLRALGRSLAECDEVAASQHCLPASVHGEQRWDAGWSLPEVVRDYQILRLVLLDYLEEELEAAPELRVTMAVCLALDEAIAASVLTYVNTRDEALRRVEEERARHEQQAQEQLRQQAEILREVDRRKSEFLATLGHELRNPLAPLWHAVEMLGLHQSTLPALARIRDVTARQVEQLTRLADDLLDISRIAQNRIELRTEPLDAAIVVSQAAQTSEPHLNARRHRFEVVKPTAPLWVHADPARLVQVLVNLLNNAAKYTEPGGHVRLSAEREGDEAVIRVSDDGMGIPPEMLPHVFELFTQAEWARDHAQGGMGIGLALVRRLVDLHGGTITAHSAGPGRGSEFTLRLPLAAAPPQAGDPALADGSPGVLSGLPAAQRILVVDDNVDAAQLLGLLLASAGHHVQEAYDGPTAVRIADEFRPEAIFLDIGLPGMNGYEVARELRRRPALEQTLLVALTGYGQDEDRRRAEEVGFDAHLVKPAELSALQAILARNRPPCASDAAP